MPQVLVSKFFDSQTFAYILESNSEVCADKDQLA